MLVGCGFKDELKYWLHKRASSSLEATILGTIYDNDNDVFICGG